MSGFKAKMHQIRLRLGLRHRPRWGSLQRSPDPLDVFQEPTSKGRKEKGEGKGRGREKKGKERELDAGPAGRQMPRASCWQKTGLEKSQYI